MKHTMSHPLRVAAAGGVAAAILAGGGAVALASGSDTTPTPPSAGSTSSSTAPAPKAHVPHLDGTVTSVNGSDIVIKDRDGFTRTITTSGSTVYSNGLSASPAVGSQVHATGTVDANGTSLDAAALGTPPTPPPGRHGKHGPGAGPGALPGSGTRPAAPPAPPEDPRRRERRVDPQHRRRPRRHPPPESGGVTGVAPAPWRPGAVSTVCGGGGRVTP
jgi:hypothetical protein